MVPEAMPIYTLRIQPFDYLAISIFGTDLVEKWGDHVVFITKIQGSGKLE